jgi:hypothetical protein
MHAKKIGNNSPTPHRHDVLHIAHNTGTTREGGETTMPGSNRNSNQLVVPQANAALDQMKYEVAQELGIALPQDGYYGNLTTRDAGSIGGYITRKLVQIAEQSLAGQFK